MYKFLPNTLSLSRIIFAFILIFTYSKNSFSLFLISLLLILIAIITDILDGKLARKYKKTSDNGYVIDGLGDRALYISFYLIFYNLHHVNIGIIWLLIFREIAIYALRIMLPEWRFIKGSRLLSLIHAGIIRVWILNYLLWDFICFFSKELFQVEIIFGIIQFLLVLLGIIFSYYGLINYIKVFFKER